MNIFYTSSWPIKTFLYQVSVTNYECFVAQLSWGDSILWTNIPAMMCCFPANFGIFMLANPPNLPWQPWTRGEGPRKMKEWRGTQPHYQYSQIWIFSLDLGNMRHQWEFRSNLENFVVCKNKYLMFRLIAFLFFTRLVLFSLCVQ